MHVVGGKNVLSYLLLFRLNGFYKFTEVTSIVFYLIKFLLIFAQKRIVIVKNINYRFIGIVLQLIV